MAYPATTDADKLACATENLSEDRRVVVFSTYQSIQVVSDAQSDGLGDFDLIICDEAHRTTGLTLPGEDSSDFVKVHSDTNVRGKKRLYMTATPRIYTDASKTKARESDAALYSMDDEFDTFGPEFYRLGFGRAVEQDLLSEYKVLIVAVEQDKMGALANDYNKAYRLDEKNAIDINFATKIVGSWKGLSKIGLVVIDEDGEKEALKEDTEPMRRAVAFSRSIKASKQINEVFGKLVKRYNEAYLPEDASDMVQCRLKHVDGTMNALQRFNALSWLKENPGSGYCRVLSNARCLSEGIDVPALDSVVFFDTRESIVDIVQSVGRVMRKAKGKKYGYIILPVCIPSQNVVDYNSYIEGDPQFRSIWKVIKALRAHDESLVDEAEFRRKIRIISGDPSSEKGRGNKGGALPLDIPTLPIGDISEAVYAAIPKKLGDREYWSEWAKSISGIAEKLIARIKAMIKNSPEVAMEFERFVKGVQHTLNPVVTDDEAVEMLAQHILTMPVFKALFAATDFPKNNVVGNALEAIVQKLDVGSVNSETMGLKRFYDNVNERISLAKSDKSKQEIIRNLYDTFFKNAFPRMASRLGIVYTPIPVVDFILRNTDATLHRHFGKSLASEGVHILDPFAGTGTFLVRLIQSGLIGPEELEEKYGSELHANELLLLAYYIATVNIETAYHSAVGNYRPFDGMILIDTFQMTEDTDMIDKVVLPENNKRAKQQLNQPIQVIVGNPPYKAQQASQNDNNPNLSYPELDGRIRSTYAKESDAGNKKNLYDSYIRAIRWASDRIEDRGIVAYVTNGSFLDAKNMDGLRLSLAKEFSHLYILNLRGNRRTSGDEAKREGENIFQPLSRTTVAITIMVKDPSSKGSPCQLHYHDIGDYLARDEKLSIIDNISSLNEISWQHLQPNTEGDWINQRDPAFDNFMPLTVKDKTEAPIFDIGTSGVVTARDAWTINFSREALEANMRRTVNTYSVNRERFAMACVEKTKDEWPDVKEIIDTDPRQISWSRALMADIKSDRRYAFDEKNIIKCLYRPFTPQWLYFSRDFIECVYQQPRLFPTPRHQNMVICAAGSGANKAFSAFVTACVPDYELVSKGQCVPLYYYERTDNVSDKQTTRMFEDDAHVDADGYVRRDSISDGTLTECRHRYGDKNISKEDIFWYVYGILHSAEYKDRFSSSLKKMTPRVPVVDDFHSFSNAGRELGQWHLDYETVDPYPLEEDWTRFVMDDADYRVNKMIFGTRDGEKDRSVIVYNPHLTLKGIPLETYGYVVNGKSALEWVMERYAVSTHKDSQIKNDPNDWSDDPRYIIDLVKRVVRVSLETVRIVSALPPLNEHD